MEKGRGLITLNTAKPCGRREEGWMEGVQGGRRAGQTDRQRFGIALKTKTTALRFELFSAVEERAPLHHITAPEFVVPCGQIRDTWTNNSG